MVHNMGGGGQKESCRKMTLMVHPLRTLCGSKFLMQTDQASSHLSGMAEPATMDQSDGRMP